MSLLSNGGPLSEGPCLSVSVCPCEPLSRGAFFSCDRAVDGRSSGVGLACGVLAPLETPTTASKKPSALSRPESVPDSPLEAMTETLLEAFGHLTIQDLRLLALIRSGVDNRPDLVDASAIPERTVFRRVDMFRGSPRYQDSKVLAGYPPLVMSRKHPHQAGMQFFLSPLGESLLAVTGAIATGDKERAR